MRRELEELLKGTDSKELLLSEILRKGAAVILQELSEQGVTGFPGRDQLREKKGEDTGYRNGYGPFNIKTAGGKICVYKPQVRNTEKPFCSKLAAFFRDNSEILEKLALEMYTRGLSTRGQIPNFL